MMLRTWPSATATASPMFVRVTNFTPDWHNNSTRRSTRHLSSFIMGIPYISKPPMRSARSYTVTSWPARFSWSAAASPAGPDPTTATVKPVRCCGWTGVTQPSSKPRSTIACSISLMVTAGSVIPRTHAPSQGAGQTRPVNSGKLLVAWRRSSAARHSPRYTRSFHSGIRLSTGQPSSDWQKGTPQSIQRAP